MRFFLALLALLTAGCASVRSNLPSLDQAAVDAERLTVQRAAVEEALARDERVRRLAWPLLTKNVELCRDTTLRTGIRLGDADAVVAAARGLTDAQVEAMGFSDEVFILSVPPQSPAAEAGLSPLTKVLRIGDAEKPIETASDFGEQHEAAFEKFEAGETKALRFEVEEQGEVRTVEVVPELACEIRVVSSGRNSVNASANFDTINIYAGLIRALEDNDDALSFVIAHEIAHVTGRHARKGLRNASVTGALLWGPPLMAASSLVDDLTYPLTKRLGAKAPPLTTAATKTMVKAIGVPNFEREADYLALYMLARADVDAARAPEVFQLFANMKPLSSWLEVSHPVVPERTLRLRMTAEEIAAKQAAGEPLIPNGWEEINRNKPE